MSKGSAPRPFSVSANEYGSNWDQIFRKDAGAKDGPTYSEGQAEEQPKGLDDGDGKSSGRKP